MRNNVSAANQALMDAAKLNEIATRISDVFCNDLLAEPTLVSEPVCHIECHRTDNPGFVFSTSIGTVRARLKLKPEETKDGAVTGLKASFYFFSIGAEADKELLLEYSFDFDVQGRISAAPYLTTYLPFLEKGDEDAKFFRQNVLGELVYRLAMMVGAGFNPANAKTQAYN
jgi:hypothetical protein